MQAILRCRPSFIDHSPRELRGRRLVLMLPSYPSWQSGSRATRHVRCKHSTPFLDLEKPGVQQPAAGWGCAPGTRAPREPLVSSLLWPPAAHGLLTQSHQCCFRIQLQDGDVCPQQLPRQPGEGGGCLRLGASSPFSMSAPGTVRPCPHSDDRCSLVYNSVSVPNAGTPV